MIYTDTGFCGYEVEETEWGTYGWPETGSNSSAALTCVLDSDITVRRDCLVGGQWDESEYGTCRLLGIEVGFHKHSEKENIMYTKT